MPPMLMQHDTDPRQDLLNKIGSLKGVDVFNNTVLVVLYERPAKTKSGLHLPDSVRDEDQHQGKAALIVKKGPQAFVPSENSPWFEGETINEGDWIAMRPSDGWPISVNGVKCRMLADTAVRMRIPAPDSVW